MDLKLSPSPELVRSQGQRRTILRGGFGPLACGIDAVVILASALAGASLYHIVAYGDAGDFARHIQVGLGGALFFIVPGIVRGDYHLANYLSSRHHLRHVGALWNLTFLCLLSFGFLTKLIDVYSRGALVLFYLAGFPALMGTRLVLVRLVVLGAKLGIVNAQRVMIVGREGAVTDFITRYQPWNMGLHVVAATYLTGHGPPNTPETISDILKAELKNAVETARRLHPDAVLIISPWSDQAMIDLCIESFLTTPVEIHLGPERILDRFENVRISRFGPLSTVQLTRMPLSGWRILQKRIFDIALTSIGVAVLAPLFLVAAGLVWLETGRPVLFSQRRYGFNQEPFRIIKFRTMTTLEDGGSIRQATRSDPRVTRVGRWLRRWNLDELPQLVNVLRGEMSLVGPRPHAVIHNLSYENKILLYARRHNVKPGITGWAQVNGFRGETDTDAKMEQRVDHDLYYIDNWSIWFDIRILVLTLFSPKSYRNAL